MKNILSNIKSTIISKATTVKNTITSKCGEGYVDTGVKILIAVVIGALLLGLLYTLFNTTIMPTVSDKIVDLFSFSGATE